MTQASGFSGGNIKPVPRYYHCPISMLFHPCVSCSGCTAGTAIQLNTVFNAPLSLPPRRTGMSEGWQLNTAFASFSCSHTHTCTQHRKSALTVVHGPHDAKSRSSDFIKGLPASDHLPENDPPAEHIALLAVIAACEHKQKAQRHFREREEKVPLDNADGGDALQNYLEWGPCKDLFYFYPNSIFFHLNGIELLF